MVELIRAGGWLMLPIILCSIISVAIILERFWALRRKRVMPSKDFENIHAWADQHELDQKHIEALRNSSPTGRILAAALDNRHRSREIIKEVVQDTGRHVIHELEKYLNTLGTIAGVSPLLGLLGTVIGMISVFSAIITYGVGDPTHLAGGISQALITTAAGLTVAIPTYFFYRFFQGRVAAYVVTIEQQAMALLETIDRDS